MNIIRAAQICFEYITRDENDNIIETTRALDNLDIEIEKSSFVALLGHNGCGKSTFARLINALNLPKSGTLLVDGMDTADGNLTLKIRETAGMVFQNPDNQIISNVVEEDVAFGPENIGVPQEEIVRRVDEAINAVGMSEYRYKSPNQLSGGQKQRVAIAGIMAMRPQCIVFDEPTAMLDPDGRKDVLEIAHRLNREEGITIVLITHYMEEAVNADRIIVMEKGSIALDKDGNKMDGTPREIFSRVDDLKGLALTVPVITELAYELRREGIPIPEGVLTRDELTAALKSLYQTANGK